MKSVQPAVHLYWDQYGERFIQDRLLHQSTMARFPLKRRTSLRLTGRCALPIILNVHSTSHTNIHQIMPFQKKNSPYVTIFFSISTKLTPECPSSSPPLCKPKFIFLPSIFLELAYLAMSFILQLTHPARSVRKPKNKRHCQIR